jgi:meso-butanediol dehydrogenase/(S,S)-butanediol dehydrogenase/diacetyl reductase
MLAARTASTLADVATTLRDPERVAWRSTDVSDEAAVEQLVAYTLERFGGVHLLVNNAGIGGLSKVVDTTTPDWMKVFAVDLHASFYLCRAAIPHMVSAGGGAILNMASIGGMSADCGFGAYNAAKAALINFTRTLALEHADNVRVNSISPGFIRTPASTTLPAEFLADSNARIPMGRWGRPEEIAGAAAFLLSPDASYITGENLVIDGGMRASSHNPSFLKMLDQGWTGRLVVSQRSDPSDKPNG